MTDPKKLNIEDLDPAVVEALIKRKNAQPPKDSWEEEQEKRGYYYDDAHGYEVYVPEEDEDD